MERRSLDLLIEYDISEEQIIEIIKQTILFMMGLGIKQVEIGGFKK